MMSEIRNPHRAARRVTNSAAILYVLLGVFLNVLLYFCTGSVVMLSAIVIMCTCSLLAVLMILLGDLCLKRVTLTEEGVRLSILIWTRMIPWSAFQAVGMVEGNSRFGKDYVRMLELRADNSSRPKIFTTVRLPLRQDILDFVVTYYGPLDFDLSK